MDFQAFNSDLQYEIPDLYRVDGVVSIPTTWFNIFEQKSDCEEYDQFSLFDYIEFFAENCKDYENGSYHNFFGHYHLIFKNSDLIYTSFQKDINDIFKKTGLLYRLTDEKIIERIVENSPLSPGIEHQVSQIKEKGIKELLKEAIVLYKNPFPGSSKDAVEKIWDALERLKTYYSNLDKKTSASKIVNDMANNDPTAFADYLSKQLIEKLESFDDDFECDRSESSNTNKNTVKYSSNTNNTNQSNVDKNVFPSFCRNCGVRLIDKPYWCNYCGTQIRAKREWYCAVCGDHLNEQKNFNSESGCWVCLKCKSINRVKEHFY